MSIKTKIPNKRKYIRYIPDNTLGFLSTDLEEEEFAPEVVGLVFSEAYQGCALVFLNSVDVKKNDLCVVQCGDLPPTKSEIVWVEELDENLVKVGIKYQL